MLIRSGYLETFRLLPRLGFINALRVLAYRLTRQFYGQRNCKPIRLGDGMRLFEGGAEAGEIPCFGSENFETYIARADAVLAGRIAYYQRDEFEVSNPPDWFFDPYSQRDLSHLVSLPWSKIDEFSLGGSDIKNIWELSRFQWAVDLAIGWRMTRDVRYIERLNVWMLDWIKRNPPYLGPHWYCGQECSFRLLNFIMVRKLLGEMSVVSAPVEQFIKLHLERIQMSLGYAIAQQNNHATSEAVALYVGGCVLENCGAINQSVTGGKFRRLGMRALKSAAEKLILSDGSFSQRSTNYHRVLIDTLSLFFFWNRFFGCEAPPETLRAKFSSAICWLFQLTDPETGEVPNFGHNDGSQVLRLSGAGYRDFRPSVQLAAVVLRGERLYKPGEWDDAWKILDLQVQGSWQTQRGSTNFADGGYIGMCHGDLFGFVHCPKFRFRPAHCDILHFDLWWRGRSILCDSGTFSYNCSDEDMRYFPGTAAHNCVQFGTADQMPRIGRFLFGRWVDAATEEFSTAVDGSVRWMGSFKDYRGNVHRRSIVLDAIRVSIEDSVFLVSAEGRATLRWHLGPGQWGLSELIAQSELASVELGGDVSATDIRLITAPVSLYYNSKVAGQCLEVGIRGRSAKVTTVVNLKC